jgi:calcium/calmodulin-dependent protein kinase I
VFAIRGAQKSALTTQCGTPGYVAPEILQNQPYDKSVDMWSIGVITYILLGGYPPFHDDNQKALFKKIKKGEFEFHDEYWDCVSAEAKDFISSLIKVNPKDRLNCDEAHNHPWLKRDAKELADHNLNNNLAALKKYQNNRKFRAAANAIIAVNRIGNMMGGSKSAGTTSEPEKTTPAV